VRVASEPETEPETEPDNEPDNEPDAAPPRPAAGRRQATMALALGAVAIVLSLVVGLIVFKVSQSHHDRPGSAPERVADADGCRWWTAPRNTVADQRGAGAPPPSRTKRVGTRTMTLVTDRGTIEIRLDAGQTPCTVASFSHLAVRHFYDNTTCHRLVTSGIYLLQCGDPTGTGRGGPGYVFADEPAHASPLPAASGMPGRVTYPRGTVGLANFGKDTNGSQFFIVYKDSPIPPAYPAIGTVTSGLDVVDRVAAGGDDGAFTPDPGGGRPKLPITIRSVSVV
jgi:peptidyl-prolyl cis-trans isomerase B (cyclophilin B)